MHRLLPKDQRIMAGQKKLRYREPFVSLGTTGQSLSLAEAGSTCYCRFFFVGPCSGNITKHDGSTKQSRLQWNPASSQLQWDTTVVWKHTKACQMVFLGAEVARVHADSSAAACADHPRRESVVSWQKCCVLVAQQTGSFVPEISRLVHLKQLFHPTARGQSGGVGRPSELTDRGPHRWAGFTIDLPMAAKWRIHGTSIRYQAVNNTLPGTLQCT